MTADRLDTALGVAQDAARHGDEAGAWAALTPLLRERSSSVHAARGLATALRESTLERTRRLVLAEELVVKWPRDVPVLRALGEATYTLVDRTSPNARPPQSPFFHGVVLRLEEAAHDAGGDAERLEIAFALAIAARIAGRRWDEVAEAAHHLVITLRPSGWTDHTNYGVFLKSRGRWDEGLWANRRAAELGGRGDESVVWNLAICATAAGQGAAALGVWRSLGMELELGEDGLPAGAFGQVQVRLARRPLAERTAEDDDPGPEETVWVERISPCHGRIRSATFQELGADYGDLVLFDGAPILTRQHGNRDVPVFPQLTTLRRTGWQIVRFTACGTSGDLVAAGRSIAEGCEVVVHEERTDRVCARCVDGSGPHPHTPAAARVVRGKLCVPPGILAGEIAEHLDRAGPLRWIVPELYDRLGLFDRADEDRRRLLGITS